MNKNQILDWLFQNATSNKLPEKWCELLDVYIIDFDGWRNVSFTTPCSLIEFVDRLSHCTIKL
jgi:hypothetical protein